MALNMADLFEHAVDTFPERVALICRDRQVTYSGLEDEANRLAHHLAARGSAPAATSACTPATPSRPWRHCSPRSSSGPW